MQSVLFNKMAGSHSDGSLDLQRFSVARHALSRNRSAAPRKEKDSLDQTPEESHPENFLEWAVPQKHSKAISGITG